MKANQKSIRCILGDITDSKADAIVNAANNHLWMGAGVAGAIKRKGGEQIEIEAVSKGPIEVGEAVITAAGKLACHFIIHAAVMGQDLRADEDKIRRATLNSLKRAEELKINSIDFPALGTGVGVFPAQAAARIMIDAAKEFLQISRHVKTVGLVLYDKETYDIFVNILGAEKIEL